MVSATPRPVHRSAVHPESGCAKNGILGTPQSAHVQKQMRQGRGRASRVGSNVAHLRENKVNSTRLKLSCVQDFAVIARY